MLSKVLSCPPCADWLDVNTPAGLSLSRPDNQSSLVVDGGGTKTVQTFVWSPLGAVR